LGKENGFEMSFFLTLPCTASRPEYPENRIGKYTTLLAHEIELNDNYEVGLCDIIIPERVFELQDDTSIELHVNSNWVRDVPIRKNDIHSWSDLRSIITDEFRINCYKEKVEFIVQNNATIRLKHEWFRLFMGDVPAIMQGYEKNGTTYVGNIRRQVELAYIYVDICANTFIGDSLTPCIRVVTLEPHKPTIISFVNVHYQDLQNIRFSTVTIEIADDRGKTLKFANGFSLVKLHFRLKK
jgi:hypothetical protein